MLSYSNNRQTINSHRGISLNPKNTTKLFYEEKLTLYSFRSSLFSPYRRITSENVAKLLIVLGVLHIYKVPTLILWWTKNLNFNSLSFPNIPRKLKYRYSNQNRNVRYSNTFTHYPKKKWRQLLAAKHHDVSYHI